MTFESSRFHFSQIIEQIKQEGLYKEERLICSPQAGKIKVRFPSDGETATLYNFCSNNYLGLSSHPDVLAAAHQGLDQKGYGMSSVRFICGTQDIHRELEQKMSQFLNTEDTILFASCFDANAALFEVLLTEQDGIFSDKLVHASIIDGIRLCKAQRHIFAHSDMNDLEAKLKNSTCRTKLIMTDGVFSMDGDMAKLDEIADLADKYDAILAVDDSHATGFIGKTGRGTHEHFDVMNRVDIITTTFGKALGGATGGCISGRKEIITLLKQRGRPYLFSNSLMPAVVFSSLKVLDILSTATDRRDHLERLTQIWRTKLAGAGFDLKPGNTPIVPIMLYNAQLAQDFSRDLYHEGVFAVGFFYPVVPKGEARIRTQMSAALTEADLEIAGETFVKVGKKYGILSARKEEINTRFGD